jgi:uroporphyrin-3 C-methyltransferase
MAEDKDAQSSDEKSLVDPPDEVVDAEPETAEGGEHAQKSAEVVEEQTVPAPKARGRFLTFFATLLAMLALAGVGYLYYLSLGVDAVEREDIEAVANELAKVSAAQQREAQSSRAALDEAMTRFENEMASQRASIKSSEQALAESISESLKREPPTSREWKLAEVEYLMRIANHRLLMERDVRGASLLLAAADDVLAGLDDFSLFPVRSALAEELASLGAIVPLDVQGAFLRLEAIKARLNELPLRLPQFIAGRQGAADIAASSSLWERLVDRVLALFEFRRYDEAGVRPLLTPQEATFLEVNLRLMLERAQLALLRQDAVLFEVSLGGAREWLDLYLERDNAAVADVASELDQLMNVDLDRPLPDISGSLMALKSVSRSPSEETDSGS